MASAAYEGGQQLLREDLMRWPKGFDPSYSNFRFLVLQSKITEPSQPKQVFAVVVQQISGIIVPLIIKE